jgi:chloramphenicol 3-O-phosphotransferase
VDDLREWVVSGLAPPVPVWTNETTRQFRLARNAAVHTARIYADEGFTVVIDDVIYPEEAEELFAGPLSRYELHKVLLKPRLETVLARNAQRTNKSFDTSLLDDTCRALHRAMSELDFAGAGWIVVDSSDMSVEETANEVLRRIRG